MNINPSRLGALAELLAVDYLLVVVVLLLVVLTARELLRAYGGAPARPWHRALNYALWPLMLASGLFVAQRLLTYLHWAG